MNTNLYSYILQKSFEFLRKRNIASPQSYSKKL